jgi:hypothetical protein
MQAYKNYEYNTYIHTYRRVYTFVPISVLYNSDSRITSVLLNNIRPTGVFTKRSWFTPF